MGSDRARETFNETRQYRRVVQQQGRVVLEADTNEAQLIVTEEMRQEMLDVVGPCGVPRDPISGDRGHGYRIHTLKKDTRDFRIGVGSLYLGGWSVRQGDGTLTYGKQLDWLDGPDPPLPEIQASKPDKEIVYLRLREQEVSAVEDPTLVEPALGGPDTAQRVRLVRRVGRAPVATPDGSALQQIDWENPGIVLQPDQATLGRTALLSVSFDPVNNAYIGSENQMIRVQAGTANSGPQLLWGYDDASSLYSAEIPDPTNPAILKLLTTPVDDKHQPKIGQYAEVLLAAVDLRDGAYVAAPTGALLQVTQTYDPMTQTIGLEPESSSTYATATPLFVRIWENSIDVATAFGTAAALIDANGNATGLQIELTDKTNPTASVEPGDFWSFAVRPSMPTSVFPKRYSEPQPPDGLREWVCPLAVIDWTSEDEAIAIADCRPSFGNLTTLSGSEAQAHRGGPAMWQEIKHSVTDGHKIKGNDTCDVPIEEVAADDPPRFYLASCSPLTEARIAWRIMSSRDARGRIEYTLNIENFSEREVKVRFHVYRLG